MNIPLERLIEGMIATLRNDVIPHVQDGYARGQAIGIIDLFNNIAPRVEWAREPLLTALAARGALLRQVAELVPDACRAPEEFNLSASSSALAAERDRLDGVIGDLIGVLAPRARSGDGNAAEALAAIRGHLHEDIAAEMKLTRKPLFAEIASGGAARKAAG